MPTTTNLALPYPAASDNPQAPVLAALAKAVDAYTGPWTDWTPTFTQGVSITFTLRYAKYRRIDKMLEWAFAVVTTVGGTGGQPLDILMPPVAPKYSTTVMPRGLVDVNLANNQFTVEQRSGSTTVMRVKGSTGDYTTALVNGSQFTGWGQYEVA
jgi:hypothetical protein